MYTNSLSWHMTSFYNSERSLLPPGWNLDALILVKKGPIEKLPSRNTLGFNVQFRLFYGRELDNNLQGKRNVG